MSRLKVSPGTFGLMVARLALEYEVVQHLMTADNSGEAECDVHVQTDAQKSASEFARKMGSTPRLEDLGEVRKYRRSGETYNGLPVKIWEEVPTPG